MSAELGESAALAQAIREWKASAAIYADPELLAKLTGPLDDDHGPVPVPSKG